MSTNVVVILDDGQTFGGIDGAVVAAFNEEDLSEEAAHALSEGADITQALDEIEEGRAKGRLFNLEALIRFYLEVEKDEGACTTLAAWEAYNQVPINPTI